MTQIQYEAPDGVSVMLGSATNSQQDASEQPSSIRLTVTLPVNGLDYRLLVEESTPSRVVLSPTSSKSQESSKPATTGRTRTRSTTSQETSTESATDATTDGTQQTTPTTSPTSGGRATKSKYAGVSKADPVTYDSHGIKRHYKKAPGYSNIQTRNAAIVRYHSKGMSYGAISQKMGLSRARIYQILKKEGATNGA